MRPTWRTILLAGLAALLLVSSGKRLAIAALTPQQIGAGLDTMVLVPAGHFIRGSTSEELDDAHRVAEKVYGTVRREWFERERPQRRIYLDAYYIDKYPVTIAQFYRFEKPRLMSPREFSGPRLPVVGVTWRQARDYCRSVGKRLPTEAEWEKAARWVDGRKHPWGDQWGGSKVIWKKNSGGKFHPVDRTYNTHQSPYGVVDMVGNVWEWVGDWYKAGYYREAPKRNPKGPSSGRWRVIRGGSWLNIDPTFFRAASRDWYRPFLAHHDLGFRCAKAP